MMNIFSHNKRPSKVSLMASENSSEDSVDRALRSENNSKSELTTGKSSFRNKEGDRMYLSINQSGSNISLAKSKVDNNFESNTEPKKIHKKSKSEGQTNPDLLPRHPEPKQSFEVRRDVNDKLHIPKIIIPKPGKSGRRESMIDETKNYEIIKLEDDKTEKGQIRRRQPIVNEDKLRINTDDEKIQTNRKQGSENHSNYDNHAISSAVSPHIVKPGTITKGKINGKPALIKSGHNRRNSSSSSSDGTRQLIAKAILQDYDQGQHNIAENFPDIDQREMIGEYLKLIQVLKIERIFFNPELDILNRFCLEYTSLCGYTEPRGMFIFKVENHYLRVYNYMEKRINSTSTPTHEGSVGVEVPTLITRLFLGDFRITSDGTSKIDITIPILSHNHKLSLERFKAIVENIFHKKRKYYKMTDISRHEMVHLA